MTKFEHIIHGQIENYLSANGWILAKRIPDEIAIWETGQGPKHRVWVPLDTEFADYAKSLSRIFSSLSSHENREELNIIEDVESFQIGDILRVRSEDPLNRRGSTLPIVDGIELIKKARDMVVYSACSTLEAKANHSNFRPQQVKDYMGNVRVGQTERGSYIVKIISPLPKEVVAQLPLEFGGSEKPYERRVVETLMGGLDTVKTIASEAAEKGKFEPGPFLESVEDGVSANLCYSIIRTAKMSNYMPLGVNVSWAYSPYAIDDSVCTTVSIPVPIMTYIAAAANALREIQPEKRLITGHVTNLHRDPKLGPGRVTIGTFIEGKARTIHIELSEPDYKTAIEAHKGGNAINCWGEIRKEGKFLKLYDPTDFQSDTPPQEQQKFERFL